MLGVEAREVLEKIRKCVHIAFVPDVFIFYLLVLAIIYIFNWFVFVTYFIQADNFKSMSQTDGGQLGLYHFITLAVIKKFYSDSEITYLKQNWLLRSKK